MEQAGKQRKDKAGADAPARSAGVSSCTGPGRRETVAARRAICHVPAKPRQSSLDRLRRALTTVAELLCRDPAYAPIFLRLEEEIATEEARLQDDLLARARAIARQNAMG